MYNGHIWQTTFKINCSKNLSLCSGSNVEVLQTQKCEHDNQSSSMPIFCGPHWLNDKRKLEQKLAFWKSLVTSSMLWRTGSLRTSLFDVCSGSNVDGYKHKNMHTIIKARVCQLFLDLLDKRSLWAKSESPWWSSLPKNDVTGSMLWRWGSLRTSLFENANMGED